MSNLKNIQFQWYNNGIKNIKPSGLISLATFVDSIRAPKPHMIEAFAQIEKAAKEGNKELKDKIKTEKLFFVTPSCLVNPIRNYESVYHFNPICVAEYDNIEYSEELRDYIFNKIPSCISAFTSPSKKGSKFLFHIEQPQSISHYKELFFGIAYDLDKFSGLDLSNERITQPLFNSYDPNIKFRENALKSTKRGFKINAFDADKEIDFDIPQEVDEELEKKVVEKIYFLIDRIVDNAHPQLLGICFLIGGWSASNYIHQELAFDSLIDAITNNEYMSKNTKNYCLTAKQMFAKGLNHPAEFKQ